MTKGVFVRKDEKRGSNRKGTDDVFKQMVLLYMSIPT